MLVICRLTGRQLRTSTIVGGWPLRDLRDRNRGDRGGRGRSGLRGGVVAERARRDGSRAEPRCRSRDLGAKQRRDPRGLVLPGAARGRRELCVGGARARCTSAAARAGIAAPRDAASWWWRATQAELGALERCARQGAANGVPRSAPARRREVQRARAARARGRRARLVPRPASSTRTRSRLELPGGAPNATARRVALARVGDRGSRAATRAVMARRDARGGRATRERSCARRRRERGRARRATRVAALAGVDVDAAGYGLRPVQGRLLRASRRRRSRRLCERLVYPLPASDAGSACT